jgi:hypothetical protein
MIEHREPAIVADKIVSPSVTQERTGSAATASAASGKRLARSWPFLLPLCHLTYRIDAFQPVQAIEIDRDQRLKITSPFLASEVWPARCRVRTLMASVSIRTIRVMVNDAELRIDKATVVKW